MEWLLAADGKYISLTATQALLIDTQATAEDVADAIADVNEAALLSGRLITDSRRRRRIRQSGLRVVPKRSPD
jgi:hypothetical protein